MSVIRSLLDAAFSEGATRIHVHPPAMLQQLQFRLADGLAHARQHPNVEAVFDELDLVGKGWFEGNIVYRGRTIRYFQSIATTGPDLVLILEPFDQPIDFPTRPDIVLDDASGSR
ncbi:MAG TPA: hypothetical protein VKQ27_16780 [Acetobacteraceae bacterium]|nr:hypothetical protein [Acetobacteraceae bacterium]